MPSLISLQRDLIVAFCPPNHLHYLKQRRQNPMPITSHILPIIKNSYNPHHHWSTNRITINTSAQKELFIGTLQICAKISCIVGKSMAGIHSISAEGCNFVQIFCTKSIGKISRMRYSRRYRIKNRSTRQSLDRLNGCF